MKQIAAQVIVFGCSWKTHARRWGFEGFPVHGSGSGEAEVVAGVGGGERRDEDAVRGR
jgi:hypothetical protein